MLVFPGTSQKDPPPTPWPLDALFTVCCTADSPVLTHAAARSRGIALHSGGTGKHSYREREREREGPVVWRERERELMAV